MHSLHCVAQNWTVRKPLSNDFRERIDRWQQFFLIVQVAHNTANTLTRVCTVGKWIQVVLMVDAQHPGFRNGLGVFYQITRCFSEDAVGAGVSVGF